MINFSKTIIILNFLLAFVTMEVRAEEVNLTKSSGAKVAKIIVARAVVYSDEYLLSPLGYIPNGKLIAVGNSRKVNQDIVPTVISGRLAYLELKDIEYLEENLEEKNTKIGLVREHNIDIVLTKPEEKLNQNNSAYFSIGRSAGGEELKNTVYNLEGLEASWLTNFGLLLVHRQMTSRFFWGAGFEYSFIKSRVMTLQTFMINPSFGYNLIKNPVFSLDSFINFDFSTGAYFNIQNNFVNDPSGFGFGPQLGVRLTMSPNTKYKLFGTLFYKQYKFYNLDKVKKYDPNDPVSDIEVQGFTALKGIGINFGFCFDI